MLNVICNNICIIIKCNALISIHKTEMLSFPVQTAAREQMKIAELRLGHLFGLSSDLELQRRTQKRADHVLNQLTAAHTSAPLRSPITCHVLDSAQGVPAQGMPLALFKLEEHSSMWEKVSSGVTNEDGRVGALLPPSNYLAPGK
jgi:hypothetical protein